MLQAALSMNPLQEHTCRSEIYRYTIYYSYFVSKEVLYSSLYITNTCHRLIKKAACLILTSWLGHHCHSLIYSLIYFLYWQRFLEREIKSRHANQKWIKDEEGIWLLWSTSRVLVVPETIRILVIEEFP